jgi:hypothetical protein
MKHRFVDTKLLYRHSQIILVCIYINGYETQKETARGCFSDQKTTTRKRKTYPYETRLSTNADANQ